MPEVAAFDVDGTLTVRDCVVPFLARVGGRTGLARTAASKPVTVARWAAQRDRDALKEHFLRGTFAGREVQAVAEQGVVFAERVARRWMRPDTTSRLRWHQARGHVVVLVSASLAEYLEPLGDLLEVDAVLCTRLSHDGSVYDGSLDGPNCRGAEKERRLVEWLARAGLAEEGVSWAYGDSAGDVEMLALARNPIRVDKATIDARPAGAT